MKKHHEENLFKKYFKAIKEKYLNDNDFKIVSIVLMIAFLFGYTVVFFDLNNDALFRNELTVPYSLEKSAMNYEIIRGYFINYLMVLLLGTLFAFPLFVFMAFVGIANGSFLAITLARSNLTTGLIYLLINIIFLKYFILISHFAIKLGKWLIFLFLKKESKIELKLLILPSIMLLFLIILNFILRL
ncbi:MAG: hypothetical protein QXR30_00870 [Candidatus Woesearchaeota archaeon]